MSRDSHDILKRSFLTGAVIIVIMTISTGCESSRNQDNKANIVNDPNSQIENIEKSEITENIVEIDNIVIKYNNETKKDNSNNKTVEKFNPSKEERYDKETENTEIKDIEIPYKTIVINKHNNCYNIGLTLQKLENTEIKEDKLIYFSNKHDNINETVIKLIGQDIIEKTVENEDNTILYFNETFKNKSEDFRNYINTKIEDIISSINQEKTLVKVNETFSEIDRIRETTEFDEQEFILLYYCTLHRWISGETPEVKIFINNENWVRQLELKFETDIRDLSKVYWEGLDSVNENNNPLKFIQKIVIKNTESGYNIIVPLSDNDLDNSLINFYISLKQDLFKGYGEVSFSSDSITMSISDTEKEKIVDNLNNEIGNLMKNIDEPENQDLNNNDNELYNIILRLTILITLRDEFIGQDNTVITVCMNSENYIVEIYSDRVECSLIEQGDVSVGELIN